MGATSTRHRAIVHHRSGLEISKGAVDISQPLKMDTQCCSVDRVGVVVVVTYAPHICIHTTCQAQHGHRHDTRPYMQ